MLTLFARDWWILVVRGVFAVLFGVMAIVWPGSALLAQVFLFGAFALVDGILAVITAVKGRREHRQWWLVLLEGLSGIAIGVLTVFLPRITGVILLYLIAG
jgi:uncharacterized membrane protein HdeD (DUF308 family)